MKLQHLSILILFVSLTVFLIIVSVFFSTVLLASYSDLEEHYIEKDLDSAVSKFSDEFYSLSSTAADWGIWDDTVHFVKENDSYYIENNLQPNSFANLNLGLMVFTDTLGNVVFSGLHDLENQEMVPVPGFFSDRIDLTNPLMDMSDIDHTMDGILMLPGEDPLLVVSQPIIYSNNTGPAQGVLIMGLFLNDVEISRLATLTRPSLSFIQADDPSLSPDLYSRLREKDGIAPGVISALNQDQVAGYSLFRDIYGNDALILRITEPRDIYKQGVATTLQVIGIILVGGLLLGLMVIILLNRVVLKKMSSLAYQVKRIGKSGRTSRRVKISGTDELSGLAREINRMLKTIEQSQKKITESEEWFRAVFSMVPHPIVITRVSDGEILMCNHAVSEIIGADPDAIIGRRSDEFPIWSSGGERESFLDNLIHDGEVEKRELSWTRPDGTVRNLLYSSRKLNLQGQEVLLNVGWDITEIRQAEQALRDSEEMFRNPVENSPVGVFLYQNSVFHYVNPRLASMVGYSPDEMAGRSFEEFVDVRDHEKVGDLLPMDPDSGREETILEFRGKRKDGSVVLLEAYCSVMQYQSAPAIYGTVIDIAGRKEAEEKLRQSEMQYRLIADQMEKAQSIAHLGNCEWKISENQVYFSDEFKRILQVSDGDERPGLDLIYDRIDPPERDQVRTLITDLLESGTPFSTRFWIHLDDGSMRAVQGLGETEYEEGKVSHLSFVVQDITESMMMEKLIRETYQEKETLLKEIHHRVKNNMQIISSLLSLQSRKIKEPSVQAIFKETQGRILSLSLVHELLYQSDDLNKINYRVYLEKLSSYLLSSELDVRKRVTCTVDSEDVEISIEKAVPCSLIITELITNSIKYAFPDATKGEISIIFRYHADSGEYLVDYRDNGKGLPEGFDLSAATGFGSSLITGLTRQLSGNLEIHNDGPGIHVIITFPQ
jgi:PAS domain S-box-containing protein